jgi:N-acetylglutamate synthase
MNAPQAAPLPEADQTASALGASWALVATALQHGWVRYDDGIFTVVTGVPIASLNGVWVVGEDADPDAVDAALASVAQVGVPFCLETRPSWRDRGAAVAAAHQLLAQPDIPMMAAVPPVTAEPVDGLEIRELEPREAQQHSDVAGPAFGAPPELLAQLLTADVLARPEVRSYVGEVDREPVVTAMSVTLGDGVGIFNVATRGPHQRRGYGAAITARCAADGFAGGAKWSWLQSSEAGYGVYERLGFTTLERWALWVDTP